MKIEWNKVTWYSKAIAIVIFVATFFVGFGFGSIYQQAQDYSVIYSTFLRSTSNLTEDINYIPNDKIASTTPNANKYNGMLICINTNDCPIGDSCLRPGPIIAGEQTPKVCVPDNQAIPL